MKLIEALQILGKARPEEPELAAALLCGFTPQPFSTFLAAHLQLRHPGRRVKLHTGLFGDLAGSLERYLREPCGTAALVLEWADLDSRLGWRQHGGWGRARVSDICDTVGRMLAILKDLTAKAAGSGVLAISLPSLPAPPVEPAPAWQYGALQARLDEMAARFGADCAALSHVRVVNPAARVLAAAPAGEERLDVRTSLQAGFPYRLPHADRLAALLATALQPPVPLKGIITDLDHTLWTGILGEVGVEGVSWDLSQHSAHHGAYQQMLQSLAESGVLVAVASKNDPALVRRAFERPDLLLRTDSVFPMEAHWRPKSESVTRILRAWNIAADSVVFVDDSPLELAEVQNVHPGIHCREFRDDPNAVAELVSELAALFGKMADSGEDALRLRSLRAGAELAEASAGTDSLEQVLAGANGVLRVERVGDPPDPRALELINKTNQFNLNGRRFTEADWLDYLRRPDHFAWMASYSDRFGALGKISVLAGRLTEERVLHVNTWVLSCRAFARRIEYAFLAQVTGQHQVSEIHFDFAATERNGPVQEALGILMGQAELPPDIRLDARDFEARRPGWFLRLE